MKKGISIFSVFVLFACAKQQIHPPVGGFLDKKDMDVSKNRAKSLNEMERAQIQDWILQQNEKFYPMALNYWTSVPGFEKRPKKLDGDLISYQYDIYDFDQVKLYNEPKVVRNVHFGKFEELKAVENALRYMNENEEVTLLIPSVLAFGTYGDNKKIPNDMPVIIKLKLI